MLTTEQIATLKKSPVYNFSLSSKELFHSNFIYWLLNDIANQNNNEECKLFWRLLCEKSLLPKELYDFEIQADIHRERNNTDLQFSILNSEGTRKRIIVENKVKSIPYIEQLEDYALISTDNDLLILLTLHDPKSLKNPIGQIELNNKKIWHVITYETFRDILVSFIKTDINASDTYRNKIVADYILLISTLIEIDKNAGIEKSEPFNWHSNEFYYQLKDLRIADFYIKKKCTLLVEEIEKALKNDEDFAGLLTTKFNWEKSEPQIWVSAGFTNGSGIIDIKYKFIQNLSIGIQIQGNQFRLDVEEGGKELGLNKSKKLAEKLNENSDWFDFTIVENSGIVYPKNNGLNKYGQIFWYRYVNIPEQTSLGKIMECILIYLKKYNNQIEYLKSETI